MEEHLPIKNIPQVRLKMALVWEMKLSSNVDETVVLSRDSGHDSKSSKESDALSPKQYDFDLSQHWNFQATTKQIKLSVILMRERRRSVPPSLTSYHRGSSDTHSSATAVQERCTRGDMRPPVITEKPEVVNRQANAPFDEKCHFCLFPKVTKNAEFSLSVSQAACQQPPFQMNER
ncbi:hypothetical protein HNY73_000836 [Argiope bruennichi]|uniref:Uncharacterized protein n=1 Tax=Argiope bruennichi TaxID=94029 RepID=A0A8T0G0M4_ARGBR|nr:hypothetical protein HNY73_000836 [Argiope bruennichi]